MSDRETGKGKVVRITSGTSPEKYLSTLWLELLSWEACYKELYLRLHPDGFRCGCGCDVRIGHGYTKTCFPTYMCKECRRKYSILSGTPFSGTKLGAKELVLFMRMWAAGSSQREIGAEIGLHRNSVVAMQQKLELYRRHMVD